MDADLFGLGGKSDETPDPAEPTRGPSRRSTTKGGSESLRPAEPIATPASDAHARTAQAARLNTKADELVELAAVIAAEPPLTPPAPPRTPPKASPREFMIAWWNGYAAPDRITRLGLPPGSRLRASEWGPTGVCVNVVVPAGTITAEVADRARSTVLAWERGDYTIEIFDATRFKLRREIVGDDPATPWRAAGKNAFRVYENARTPRGNRVSDVIWDRAGLAVKTRDGAVVYPKIREKTLGDRGPEILLDLPGGISTDAAVRTEPVLRTLFDCPDLTAEAEGTRLRIRLNPKPAEPFPTVVTMEPWQFWRPHTQVQRYLAAPHLTLPIGLSTDGETLSVPLAKRPHAVVAGQSGSGKSRTVMSMITGLVLGGASVAIGDFKGDPDLEALYSQRMPGIVHYSGTLGGISRLILWMYDELEMRRALLPILARRGVRKPVWEPHVVVIDEWGQGLDELMGSADPAERGAAAAMVNIVSKIFAQGRSYSIHLILSTQHVYASAVPGKIAQNASTRIIFGEPLPGPKGHIEGLFPDKKDAAKAAAEGILPGMNGRGIFAGQSGGIQQFQAHYGYTPGEPPETATDPELRASWERTRDALQHVPRLRRWGWKFPLDGSGEWQKWSLFPGDKTTGPLPTVHELDMVLLDGPDGRPDGEAAPWDPLSDKYFPGSPLLNPGHRSATNFDISH